MKRNKRGISLITLVITIIIMIILAGAIILTLTNSGIFDKANDAVSKYSLKEVQSIADLAWAEAFADGARDKDALQAAVDKALEDNDLNDKYKAVADEKGVTVTENKPVEVPADWKSNVSTIVDGVPIPKGFVASPYDGTDGMPAENTKAGGLVIYELKEGETSATDIREADKAEYTDLKDTHYNSMETRNQFVWVPVDKDNFANEFVRTKYYNPGTDEYQTPSATLGSGYWELELKDDNTPSDTQNSSFVSDATLTEAKAMYASVKEYGGFYIARYEVGYTYDEEGDRVPSITMGKYPYNNIAWSYTEDMIEVDNDGGAVALSRAFYPNTSDNTTGVVSTLTYGVQWDRTLNWWKELNPSFDLTNSTNYGNYYDTSIEEEDYNENANYLEFDQDAWKFVGYWNEAVAKGDGATWLLTTGAFKNANVNNVYDMAGNLTEWTMVGCSSDRRVSRGGIFVYDGRGIPVIYRNYGNPYYEGDYFGFRPSLYIKVK